MADLIVVSERSVQEIATARLKTALVDLTANLIRVVRGHGKQEELVDQLTTLFSEIDNYTHDVGQRPRGALLAALIDWNLRDNRLDDAVEYSICQAALQIVASSLLDQRTHQTKAREELRSIMRGYAEMRNEKQRRRKDDPS